MGNPGEKEYCFDCEITFTHTVLRTSCPMCDMVVTMRYVEEEVQDIKDGRQESLDDYEILKDDHRNLKVAYLAVQNRLSTLIAEMKEVENDLKGPVAL